MTSQYDAEATSRALRRMNEKLADYHPHPVSKPAPAAPAPQETTSQEAPGATDEASVGLDHAE
jgi:hypothetical protein